MKHIRADETAVRKYYDSNTERFLKFGQGGVQNGIHRAVLAPGLTMKDAFHYQENLVLKYIKQEKPTLVADLGCGTGSSLLYLNRFFKTKYKGITLSELQADMAEKLCRNYSHIEIIRGSYLHKQSYSTFSEDGSRLFFALESYLHAEDRSGFFQILSGHLQKGDILIVIDDFTADKTGSDFKVLMNDFKTGWQAPFLISARQCISYADSAGFKLIENRDLSPYLLMNRFRDRVIEFLVPLLKPLALSSPWWLNLLGGQALSRGSRLGLFQYRALVFKKT